MRKRQDRCNYKLVTKDAKSLHLRGGFAEFCPDLSTAPSMRDGDAPMVAMITTHGLMAVGSGVSQKRL